MDGLTRYDSQHARDMFAAFAGIRRVQRALAIDDWGSANVSASNTLSFRHRAGDFTNPTTRTTTRLWIPRSAGMNGMLARRCTEGTIAVISEPVVMY